MPMIADMLTPALADPDPATWAQIIRACTHGLVTLYDARRVTPPFAVAEASRLLAHPHCPDTCVPVLRAVRVRALRAMRSLSRRAVPMARAA
jgi:hypothetical protein